MMGTLPLRSQDLDITRGWSTHLYLFSGPDRPTDRPKSRHLSQRDSRRN